METKKKTKKQKHNAVVLLPMTIEVHWSYSFLFVTKDGEDGNGLKLDKLNWPVFFKFGDSLFRKTPLNADNSLCHKYISYLISGLSGVLYVWAKVLI